MLKKSITSFGLSFLILSSILHIDLHQNDNYKGPSVCDIDCFNQKHHSISNSCQRCLTKNSESFVSIFDEYFHNFPTILVPPLNESSLVEKRTFSLYSRPPPNSII